MEPQRKDETVGLLERPTGKTVSYMLIVRAIGVKSPPPWNGAGYFGSYARVIQHISTYEFESKINHNFLISKFAEGEII